jgi:hypothetical protein
MKRLAASLVLMLAATNIPPLPGHVCAEKPATYEIRLVPGGLKVFPDFTPAGAPGAPLRMTAVRNEYTPFQVAVSASENVSDFSVTVPELRGAKRGIKVAPNSIFLVENVLVKRPSIPNTDAAGKRDGKLWPDPLPPLRDFRVRAGETRAVWIDLFIPPCAEPGQYRGSVIVSSAHCGRTELPFEVDVRPITLPTEPMLRTAFGNGSLQACLEKAHGVAKGSPGYRQLVEDYYWFLVEHRLSPYYIPVDIYSDEAHRFLDDPRVTFFVIPLSGNGKTGGIWNDEELDRLSDRLEHTGWINKGAFYVIDEPREESFSDVIRLGKRIHSVNPRLRYLMTLNSGKMLARPDVLEEASIDIWVPMLPLMSRSDERGVLLEEQKKGKELWWYTCVVPKWRGMNYFIDESATAPRLHPWMSYLYGNTGILYWATDHWTQVGCDPWSETETFPTGNGDGSLLYPGAGSVGPVASIRLKMLREGLEDYDLLAMLGKRLKQAASMIGGPAAGYEPKERLFEHALALISEDGRPRSPDDEAPYLTHATQDYREIEERRIAVIDEIEKALEAPLLLVTTSPVDNGVTGRSMAVVRGYAKDDTRIYVNGVLVPVKESAFETSVALARGKNTILVEGRSGEGKVKTARAVIIRE